jgi:hypothetical protein
MLNSVDKIRRAGWDTHAAFNRPIAMDALWSASPVLRLMWTVDAVRHAKAVGASDACGLLSPLSTDVLAAIVDACDVADLWPLLCACRVLHTFVRTHPLAAHTAPFGTTVSELLKMAREFDCASTCFRAVGMLHDVEGTIATAGPKHRKLFNATADGDARRRPWRRVTFTAVATGNYEYDSAVVATRGSVRHVLVWSDLARKTTLASHPSFATLGIYVGVDCGARVDVNAPTDALPDDERNEHSPNEHSLTSSMLAVSPSGRFFVTHDRPADDADHSPADALCGRLLFGVVVDSRPVVLSIVPDYARPSGVPWHAREFRWFLDHACYFLWGEARILIAKAH